MPHTSSSHRAPLGSVWRPTDSSGCRPRSSWANTAPHRGCIGPKRPRDKGRKAFLQTWHPVETEEMKEPGKQTDARVSKTNREDEAFEVTEERWTGRVSHDTREWPSVPSEAKAALRLPEHAFPEARGSGGAPGCQQPPSTSFREAAYCACADREKGNAANGAWIQEEGRRCSCHFSRVRNFPRQKVGENKQKLPLDLPSIKITCWMNTFKSTLSATNYNPQVKRAPDHAVLGEGKPDTSEGLWGKAVCGTEATVPRPHCAVQASTEKVHELLLQRINAYGVFFKGHFSRNKRGLGEKKKISWGSWSSTFSLWGFSTLFLVQLRLSRRSGSELTGLILTGTTHSFQKISWKCIKGAESFESWLRCRHHQILEKWWRC